jgi:hypothetical protein
MTLAAFFYDFMLIQARFQTGRNPSVNEGAHRHLAIRSETEDRKVILRNTRIRYRRANTMTAHSITVVFPPVGLRYQLAENGLVGQAGGNPSVNEGAGHLAFNIDHLSVVIQKSMINGFQAKRFLWA